MASYDYKYFTTEEFGEFRICTRILLVQPAIELYLQNEVALGIPIHAP
jgi:hypothetical protein